MTYKLHADNQMWVETTYNEEMEQVEEQVTDIVDDEVAYYWITSTERDEVLKVMDFVDGEDIITQLSEGRLESFEEVTGRYEYTEIMEERPPYGE